MTNKEKIMRVSRDLFIKKGLTSTSIKDILHKSKVSNGCLFNYFKTKEAIVQGIYIDIKDKLFDYYKKEIGNAVQIHEFLWRYWKASILWSIKHKKEKQFLNMYCNTPIIKQALADKSLKDYSFIRDNIQPAIEKGEITSIDYPYFVYTFIGITDGVVQYLHEYPEKFDDKFLLNSFQQYWNMIKKS